MDQELYFSLRAEEEIAAAQAASSEAAVRAHYLLAGRYLDLACRETAAEARSFVAQPVA